MSLQMPVELSDLHDIFADNLPLVEAVGTANIRLYFCCWRRGEAGTQANVVVARVIVPRESLPAALAHVLAETGTRPEEVASLPH